MENAATEKATKGTWACLELFGHRQIPGFVEDVRWLGQDMVQVTVPGLKRDAATQKVVGLDLEHPALVQRYNGAAVFCCTPTTETAIRRGIEQFLSFSGYRSGPLALPPPGTPDPAPAAAATSPADPLPETEGVGDEQELPDLPGDDDPANLVVEGVSDADPQPAAASGEVAPVAPAPHGEF